MINNPEFKKKNSDRKAFENLVGKGQIADKQHFLLFQQ